MRYTAEELRGIRKYKAELARRRRKVMKRLTKLTAVIVAVYLIFSILGRLGIDLNDGPSAIEKYPTAQSYVDYLNSLPDSDGTLTVESVYGSR